MGRIYRTRLEVLHDFLDASRRASRKTRIIGLANLNPGYFDSYARFCLDHHLLEATPEGYHATELADQVLVAIRRVLSKTAELDGAIRSFNVVVRQDGEARELAAPPTEIFGPDDWAGILGRSAPRLSLPSAGPPGRTSRAARSDGAESRRRPSTSRPRPAPELAR